VWSFLGEGKVLDPWVFVLDRWVFVLDRWVFVLDRWVFVLDWWVFVLDHRVLGLQSSFSTHPFSVAEKVKLQTSNLPIRVSPGGRNSHVERSGILVVSLRGESCGFWSPFGW